MKSVVRLWLFGPRPNKSPLTGYWAIQSFCAGQRRQVMVPHCSPSASLCNKKARGFTLTSGGHTLFLYPALDLSVSKSPLGNQPACILKSVTNPCYWHNTHCTRLSLVLWLFSSKKNSWGSTCVWYLFLLAAPAEFGHRPTWLIPSAPAGDAADVCLPGVRGRMHRRLHLSLYRPARDQK